MQPETPQRGNQDPFRTPNQAASQIPVISSSGRRRPRSNAMKLNAIFDAIDQVEWDVIGCSRGINHEGSTQGT